MNSRGADVAKWIKAVDCESTMRGFNSRRSPITKHKCFAIKGFFFSERVTVNFSYFFFFFVKTKKQILFSLLFTTYYGGEESNYRYIYSFFYFFFQVQDNPKGLWVFFYQLGLSPHHPHGDGLQGS